MADTNVNGMPEWLRELIDKRQHDTYSCGELVRDICRGFAKHATPPADAALADEMEGYAVSMENNGHGSTRMCAVLNKAAAAPVPQPAAVNGSTHCDACGCDWLDNGLNPIGCPYCKRSGDRFNPCLNSLVRQVALLMDDCEEHADGSITIDCDISQGFLRRIYDLLSALEDCGYDAIVPQPAVPEAVAKVPDSFVEYMNKNYPAGTVIADAGWHARPIWNAACHAIQNAAILSATDSEVGK